MRRVGSWGVGLAGGVAGWSTVWPAQGVQGWGACGSGSSRGDSSLEGSGLSPEHSAGLWASARGENKSFVLPNSVRTSDRGRNQLPMFVSMRKGPV